jgi:hypothetical protein
MEGIVKREVAYVFEQDDYKITATYLSDPKGESLIEIRQDDVLVKEFLWPSYKIWNITAHADEIIEGLKKGSDEGLRIAGSDGLGGNVYRENPEA